jgi:hypothetical protein
MPLQSIMGTGMEDGVAKLECARLQDVGFIEVWLVGFVRFGNVRSKDSFDI